MTEHKQDYTQVTDLLSGMLESASEFYGSVLRSWTGTVAGTAKTAAAQAGWGRRTDSLESVLKTWQSLSSAAADPSAFSAASSLGQSMPDILFRIIQATWHGAFQVQQDWFERAGRIGQSVGGVSIQDLDTEAFKAWTEIYENELKQFFHIPQLGLTRAYQEKANRAMDRFNRLQSMFGDFMVLFFTPMEESLRLLQEELSNQVETGDFSGDYNAYYRHWVKILEGQYMRLFRTDAYTSKLVQTLNALNEFLLARDEVMDDACKVMSTPTKHELDEVYKELYQLKKRVRQLERRASAPEPGAAASGE